MVRRMMMGGKKERNVFIHEEVMKFYIYVIPCACNQCNELGRHSQNHESSESTRKE